MHSQLHSPLEKSSNKLDGANQIVPLGASLRSRDQFADTIRNREKKNIYIYILTRYIILTANKSTEIMRPSCQQANTGYTIFENQVTHARGFSFGF